MTWNERKERLIAIQKEISALGIEALRENLPMDTDKACKFLAPYADIVNAIDRLIKRGAK